MKHLFYPFNDGTGIETLDGLAPGINARGGVVTSPKIGEILREDGTYPGGLWDVDGNDEVFVIGHSHRGFKVLGDVDKSTIDQSEIVKRLKDCGLRTNVTCRIVLFACESARGGPTSLAARVATSLALTANNFACADHVWGFTRKVYVKAQKSQNNGLCVDWNGGPVEYQSTGDPNVYIHVLPTHY